MVHMWQGLSTGNTSVIFSSLFVHVLPVNTDGSRFHTNIRDFLTAAPLSMQVANVPLVLEIDPPKELFEVDQDKVFALTINPNYLKSIRLARSRSLGIGLNARTSYSDMEYIRKELEYSSKLFLQNPRWPVVGEYNLRAGVLS